MSIETQDMRPITPIRRFLVYQLAASGKNCELTKEVKQLYLAVLKSQILNLKS
jgi:hypothetical protein